MRILRSTRDEHEMLRYICPICKKLMDNRVANAKLEVVHSCKTCEIHNINDAHEMIEIMTDGEYNNYLNLPINTGG